MPDVKLTRDDFLRDGPSAIPEGVKRAFQDAGSAATPEEVYLAAVRDWIEAREAVQAEELKRAEIEMVAIEELVTNGQARSQTAAKEMKTLHPEYRKHKERLNALELAVTRAEALVEVRKAQMWRSTLTAGITEAP